MEHSKLYFRQLNSASPLSKNNVLSDDPSMCHLHSGRAVWLERAAGLGCHCHRTEFSLTAKASQACLACLDGRQYPTMPGVQLRASQVAPWPPTQPSRRRSPATAWKEARSERDPALEDLGMHQLSHSNRNNHDYHHHHQQQRQHKSNIKKKPIEDK